MFLKNMKTCLIVFATLVVHLPSYEACNTDICANVEMYCISLCASENGTEGTPNDLWCDGRCRKEHCVAGCRQWVSALNTSCYAACNSTDGHTRGQAPYCLIGCSSAISIYVDEIKARMGRIVAPMAIPGSISNTSVTLEWKWNSTAVGWLHLNPAINVSLKWCHSQQMGEEMCSTWEAVPSVTGRSGQSMVTVNALRPYTSYRFRLVIVLASDREPLTSEESAPILTLPSGLPSSPPTNIQAVVLDANRISITWDPPHYPNGPLISYSLKIHEDSSPNVESYHGSQDVAANTQRFYTFVHLKPNTSYVVSVAACNSVAEGVGPVAAVTVTTFPMEKLGNDLKPYFLIVVDDKFIFRHEPGLIDYHKSPIHESQSNITGLSVHARQGALFMSDTDGFIYELSLKPKSDVQNRWSVGKEIAHVIGLSVDWLFDRLYLLSENADGTSWLISRSKLDGRESVHVVTDIAHKPSHFEVDPFNGFLVWSVNNTDSTGGLFIVDLADLADQPLSASASVSATEGRVRQIVQSVAISAFKSDPINSRVFVMVNDVLTNRTVRVVPYSGLSQKVIRHSMSYAENVSHMTYLEEVFYWINLGNSFFEEMDPNKHVHVHRFAPKTNTSRHTALVLCDIRSQPTPIPLTRVRNLEALFGSTSVYVRWEPPSTVSHRGRGAWQSWSYHIQIVGMESGSIPLPQLEINTTEFKLEGKLRPNTNYSIVVQPATDYDLRSAPLRLTSDPRHVASTSAYFFGRTLPDGEELNSIYWATDDGTIYQSSSIGKEVRAFTGLNSSLLSQQQKSRPYNDDVMAVVNMAVMNDSMYVVTNTSQLYHIDLPSRMVTVMEGIEAVSVATDWFARKVYWSSFNRKTIGRCSEDGSEPEWLPIIGIASSMAVHSAKGKLVWCTGHSVEGSFLNADDRQSYWSSGLHSGDQALGMTIDINNDHVYWLVRKLNGASLLYRAHIDTPRGNPLINPIASSSRGPLQYMSNRLIWLQEFSNKIVMGDLNGNNTYQLSSPNQLRVNWFIPTYIYRTPAPTRPIVVPQSVDTSSIQLNQINDGSLVISWLPVANVNYGQVSYDIRVTYNGGNCTAVTAKARYAVPINWTIPPYTEMSVSIRAFSVWASANVSKSTLRSPPSKPEVPMKPRAFVSFVRNESNIAQRTEASIHFRWSPPAKANGELTGYKINCWRDKNGTRYSVCHNVFVSADRSEFVLSKLLTNENYVFTIKASTEIGYGNETHPLTVSTSAETPIPHLMIFTANLLWLSDLDQHDSLNQTFAKRTTPLWHPPVATAFINQDRKIYWIDTQGDLYLHDLLSGDIKLIHHLNGTGQSLTIDWVSRHAYWSQREMKGSSIYQLDLNKETDDDITPRLVLHDSRMVRLVEVDPFTSRLIWLSNRNGTGTLMTSNVNGEYVRPFLNDAQYCGVNNSMYIPPIALQTITTVDWSEADRPRLLWTAPDDDIWSSDLKGCSSQLEFNSTEVKQNGRWSISSLAVDQTHLYWTDISHERLLHKMRRSFSQLNQRTVMQSNPFLNRREVLVELTNVHKIVTFGTNAQPLPSIECLVPQSSVYNTEMISNTPESLTLSMPEPIRPLECNGTTMAPPRYHLYYGLVEPKQTNGCLFNLTLCLTETSSNDLVVLRKLLPFSQYVVYVTITNRYSPTEISLPMLGNGILYSTEPGAPSKPRDVTAMVVSPKSVRIQWLQPFSLNGHNVTYLVHFWPSENKVGSHVISQSKTIDKGVEDETGKMRFAIDIHPLVADTNYFFKVRAYSINDHWSESDSVSIRTYENPKSLSILNVSSTSISLEWQSPSTQYVIRHTLQFSIWKQSDWKDVDVPTDTKPNTLYNFSVNGLSPRTSYYFRLKLECSPLDASFFWPIDDNGLPPTTKGNVPDQPPSPKASKIDSGNLVQLWWGQTIANVRFILEMREFEDVGLLSSNNNQIGSSVANLSGLSQSIWKQIYNGSDPFYVVHNLTSGPRYQFRVQAYNEMGASEFSDSTTFQLPSSNNIIMIVLVSGLVTFCSVMSIFLFYVCRRTQFQGKKVNGNISSQITGSEMTDLATLRELPRRESFVQQNNAIYGVGDGDMDQELALLPHIRFEDLLITKFLGRGAFGEVFEGSTCNLPGSNQYHTKVAVKTLRKGATDQEKGEFLKEAILMSQFKHKHILRLLGVCLDADPNFILLELMEGGDLLSFLRNNRPSLREPPADSAACCQLGLLDLVSMCVDVAKGCCYLEELHFVHRDLAARNCLVSSRDPRFRVVKIGDFGLARDIYRNDYYRKEGEGLLPVRWMAPESLVDGVFTSQTDVWSFGVLLWEILTLGQQPYPARTNLQVLHFVRTGGRLDRPPNCPDSLFEHMMSCWAYEPTARPTFTKCLAELLNLQDKLQHSPFTAVHNGHYVGAPLYRGCNNKTFFQDENHNANSEPWEMNRDSVGSSGSCSYLDQRSLEQGPVLYTNDIAAVLHGLVSPNRTTIAGNRLHRLERCSSVRDPIIRRVSRPSISIVRSNSTVENPNQSAVNAHGRYLELLSDPVICNHDGYEIPRNIRYGSAQGFTNANGVLQRSHSSNSQVDNDDLSDVTDESCLANESVCTSPSRTNTILSTLSVSAMPSDINHS